MTNEEKEREYQQSKIDWQKDYNNAQKQTINKADDYTAKYKISSDAQNALDKQQTAVNKKQEEINNAVKQNASEAEIQRLVEERDSLQSKIDGENGLAAKAKKAQKETDNARKDYEKAKRAEDKLKADDPEKKQQEKEAKDAAKAEAKKSKNEAKIKSNIEKCDDPKENIHKTVCLKAGILPSTPYAIKFCTWLKNYDDTSWYIIDENNNSKIDSKALKKIKSIYTQERAGEKAEKEAEKEAEKQAKEKEKAEAKAQKEAEKEAKKAAKEIEKQQKAEAKEISKAANGLKKWRQKYLDTQRKKYNTDIIKVIPDEIDEDDLQFLGEAVCVKIKSLNDELTFDKATDEQLESIYTSVWNGKSDIIGIKTKMSQESLDNADNPELTPNTTGAFLSGLPSNTFALAQQGIQLGLASPEAAAAKAKLMTDITAAALAKLNEKVVTKLQSSIMKITDVSEIASIPAMAAADVTHHIMTADQVMKKISDALNDNLGAELAEAAANEKMAQATAKINEVASKINSNVTDKISAFTGSMADILGKANQGANWYIDNVNTLEQKYERTIIKEITAAEETVLSGKQQFVDFLVYQISYNLAAPINDALEKAQIFIIRKIAWLANQAKAKAKALAAKAIMKILGLLGA